jgi:hypothetical protein
MVDIYMPVVVCEYVPFFGLTAATIQITGMKLIIHRL